MKIGKLYLCPDRVSSIVIIIVAAWLLTISYTSEWAFQETRDGLSVGFFPRITNIATIALALLVLIFPARTYPEKLAKLTRKGLFQAVLGFTITAIYFVLLQNYGFFYSSIPCLAGSMFLLGVRPWYIALLYGVVATVVIYALFHFLGFPLPGIY